MLKLFFILSCLSALLPALVQAQPAIPDGPVRLVVPYPPGGGVDGLARPLAEKLARKWQRAVVVENKPGAATIIGADMVARSKPGSVVLLLTTDSTITSNPYFYPDMPFDPVKDLKPVTQLIDLYQILVVNPAVQANTLDNLIQLAQREPQQINYGSYGNGSQPNLLFEGLKKKTGIVMTHVPYKGIAPALQATLANEVQVTLGGIATSAGYFKSKQLRALAVAAPRRVPQYPEIPTLKELGYSDIEPKAWFGLFAPAGMPDELVDYIQRDVNEVLKDREFDATQVSGKGYHPVGSTPSEFTAFIRADYELKGKLINESNIRAD